MERRLQLSGMLIFAGLCVEVLCLFWTRPIAFVIFLAIGGLLLGLGILVYLVSLVAKIDPTNL
jgi:hypothetical protein